MPMRRCITREPTRARPIQVHSWSPAAQPHLVPQRSCLAGSRSLAGGAVRSLADLGRGCSRRCEPEASRTYCSALPGSCTPLQNCPCIDDSARRTAKSCRPSACCRRCRRETCTGASDQAILNSIYWLALKCKFSACIFSTCTESEIMIEFFPRAASGMVPGRRLLLAPPQ